jgi:hypothetical protein
MRFTSIASFVLLAGLAVVPFGSPPPRLQACAVAPPRDVKVEIASESALIIWDEKAKMEHFIRRATFSTSASNFGFLVPTPSAPTLAEVPDQLFVELAEITEPKTVKEPRPSGGCAIGCAGGSKSEWPSPTVSVREEKSVAGFKAAVLKATDAEKLAEWLRSNGYESRPALTRWLAPYVAKGYVVTAFKIEKPKAKSQDDPEKPKSADKDKTPETAPPEQSGKGTALASQAVRMSFAAQQPFFPYREPDDSPTSEKRLLRVFFIGSFKAQGQYAGAADRWSGSTVWANHLDDARWNALQPILNIPDYQPGKNAWLTEFEDRAGQRIEDDVFFSADPDEAPVSRPDRIIYTSSTSGAGPTYLGFAAFVLALYAHRLVRQRQYSFSNIAPSAANQPS